MITCHYQHLPPEVAGLVQVEALVARPLDQTALAALLLPHGGVEAPGVRVGVAVAVWVRLKQRGKIVRNP